MDDQAVRLLTEIRDLLERTVANQERVLRANDLGIVLALSVTVMFFLFFYRR